MEIVIQRGRIAKLEELPPYSIAIDGFVEGPEIDLENHRFSFDHHRRCLRFCTISATAQAHTAILLDLDPSLYTLYLNDVDIDVCGAVWCLQNPDRCKEPMVIKLVDAISKLDMHCGAISVNGMNKIVEWISAPETDSKRKGDYEKLCDQSLYSLMEAVLHRIDQYVNGEISANEISNEFSKHKKDHGDFNILRNQNDWVLVESNDPHVYQQLFQAGFSKIILIKKLKDSLAVSGVKKEFAEGFPSLKIIAALNELEPGWGGNPGAWGAPRNSDGSRSKLPLEKIIEVIDSEILKENNYG